MAKTRGENREEKRFNDAKADSLYWKLLASARAQGKVSESLKNQLWNRAKRETGSKAEARPVIPPRIVFGKEPSVKMQKEGPLEPEIVDAIIHTKTGHKRRSIWTMRGGLPTLGKKR